MNIARIFNAHSTRLGLAACLAASLFACSSTEEVDGGQGAGGDDAACLEASCEEPDMSNQGSSGGVCGAVAQDYGTVTPTVVLVIDQSGSMKSDYDGGRRWDVLKSALMDDAGVVKTFENDVRFGLALYTGTPDECAKVTDVAPAFANFDAIDAVYGPASWEQETPTGEALIAVTESLDKLDVDGPKIIVLATDGEPDTCAQPNPQEGQDVAIAAAQDAFARGIRTIVLGVGNDVGRPHLEDMANAGAGLPIGGSEQADFYRPADSIELARTFDEVVEQQRSCVLPIDGDYDGDSLTGGAVYLDGEELAYGKTDNGWTFLGSDYIVLLGEACTAVTEGDHEVTGELFCSASVSVDSPR